MQLKIVSKKEAHKIIDDVPGNSVIVLTYDGIIGISNFGKRIKKKAGKRLVDKYHIVVLSDNRLITTLNLHKINDMKNISKSIIITR